MLGGKKSPESVFFSRPILLLYPPRFLKGWLQAHAFGFFSHAEGGTQVHRGEESSDALPFKSQLGDPYVQQDE